MSLSPRVLTLTALLLVVLLAAAILVSAKNLPNYNAIEDDEHSHLPDPEGNPDDNIELSCNACGVSVEFMKIALEKLKTEFQRQPQKLKEYHALAAIDGICKKHALNVGLLAYSDKDVTKQFVHEEDAKRLGGNNVLKGGWITRFWMQKCEDMMTEAEDNLMEMMKGRQIDLCPICKSAAKIIDRRKKREEVEAAEKQKKQKKGSKQKKSEDL